MALVTQSGRAADAASRRSSRPSLAIYESAEDAGRTVAEITARAHHAGGGRDARRRDAAHGGGGHPRRLSDGCRGGAADRTRRPAGSGGGAGRAGAGGLHVCRAREFRVARSAEERDLLWKGRKNAFGAVGRVSPTYYVQDGVVPRTKIAADAALHRRGRREVRPHHQQHLPRRRRQHASDHPVRSAQARAKSSRRSTAGEDILRYCISVGGSITGEHGVGMEKTGADAGPVQRRRRSEMMAAAEDALRPRGAAESRARCCRRAKGCLEIRQPALTSNAIMY